MTLLYMSSGAGRDTRGGTGAQARTWENGNDKPGRTDHVPTHDFTADFNLRLIVLLAKTL